LEDCGAGRIRTLRRLSNRSVFPTSTRPSLVDRWPKSRQLELFRGSPPSEPRVSVSPLERVGFELSIDFVTASVSYPKASSSSSLEVVIPNSGYFHVAGVQATGTAPDPRATMYGSMTARYLKTRAQLNGLANCGKCGGELGRKKAGWSTACRGIPRVQCGSAGCDWLWNRDELRARRKLSRTQCRQDCDRLKASDAEPLALPIDGATSAGHEFAWSGPPTPG
jgi:hypothetical protein